MSETVVTQAEPVPRIRPLSFEGFRDVMAMAGPMVLGAMSYTIMEFVDKVMVARLGPEALAAVGSSGLWSYTLSTIALGIVGCVSTFVAQAYGQERKELCARFTWQGIYLSVVIGVVALIFWPLSRYLFESMNHSAEVTRQELLYFRVRLLGFGFIAWQAALSSFFQSISRPVIPMFVAFLANLLNIVLDYLLIFGAFGFPRWEIAGAAAATVISIAVQGAILHWLFMTRAIDREYQSRTAFRMDRTKMWDLLRIGFPAGVANFMDVANWAIFTSFIVGGLGTMQLAAQTAAMNFMHFTFIPMMGFMFAAQALVGQWIGRNDIRAAKARAYTAMKIGSCYMLVTGCTMAFFGRPLIETFFSTDPELVDIGSKLLILAAIFAGFDGIGILSMGGLRGAGDTKFIMIVTTLGTYLFSLPVAYALAYWAGLGAVGAWMGATVYIIFMAGILFWRFRSERWRDIKIFSEPAPVQIPAEHS